MGAKQKRDIEAAEKQMDGQTDRRLIETVSPSLAAVIDGV